MSLSLKNQTGCFPSVAVFQKDIPKYKDLNLKNVVEVSVQCGAYLQLHF